MFAALVVSVVAEGAKLVPLVLVQVIALLPEVVQSPLISEDFLHGRQHFRDVRAVDGHDYRWTQSEFPHQDEGDALQSAEVRVGGDRTLQNGAQFENDGN